MSENAERAADSTDDVVTNDPVEADEATQTTETEETPAVQETPAEKPRDPDKDLLFVARQPIFDRQRSLFGYELLFRSGRENFFSCDDGDQATRMTINNSLNIVGLSDLVGGKKAFFNLTRKLLLQKFYTVIPRGQAVVELLETIEPDAEVISACKALKEAGYMLALDDFVFSDNYRPLLAIADIVKIDFMATDREQRRALVEEFDRPGLAFLAERVETHEDFEGAVALGYTYFQGYFFCKPEIVEGRDIPMAKRNHLLLLKEVHDPGVNFDRLEQIIRGDVSLSVKLLRYLNSTALGIREKITSIKQSLILLGERPVRKWASLVALTCLGEDKPTELLRVSLARAQFCEFICKDLHMEGRELDMFLLGLLSSLDALMDAPLADLLPQLPLAGDVKATLLGNSTALGKVHLLVLALERGDWKSACMFAKMLSVSEHRISRIYHQAQNWADEVLKIA